MKNNDTSDIIDTDFEEIQEGKKKNSVVSEAGIEEEYIYARRNIVEMIEQAKSVLGESAELAEEVENPQAIYAYSSLLTTVLNANKQFIDNRLTYENIKKTKNDEDKPKKEKTEIGDVNIFVGSTSELLESLHQKPEVLKKIENIKNNNFIEEDN